MNYAFELIQVALGNRERLSGIPSRKEWAQMGNFALKQTLVGVMLSGVEVLPEEQRPPEKILMKWISLLYHLEKKYRLLEERTREAVRRLEKDGFTCAVLKGQGLARLYPDPSRRQPGDIDIWAWPAGSWGPDSTWTLRERREATVDYLRRCGEEGPVFYHHMPIQWFDDVDVEVHFTPGWMNNYFTNRRMQQWFDDQWRTFADTPADSFRTPNLAFDMVFVLHHIYRHLFGTGIGFRQIIDYYYVVRRFREGGAPGWDAVKETLQQLHMKKFTTALMWVMGEVLAMPREWMLFPPDEKEGRFLLDEILQAGNFGIFDDRIDVPEQESKGHRVLRTMRHNLRWLRHYPEESLWSPLFRAWHDTWRRRKGYMRK